MAVNRNIRSNVAYGLDNALQTLAPEPIVSVRNPTASDVAAISTLWVNSTTNAYFVLTSVSAGVSNWQAQAGGSGAFASVDVTGGAGTVLTVDAGGDTDLGGDLAVAGNTSLTGDLTVTGDFVANGDFDITSANAFSFISTANVSPAVLLQTNGGTTETMQLTVSQGTAADSLDLTSVSGGILIETTNSVSGSSIALNANSGGYQLSGVVTSSINVTGAGQDIQLNATGGSIAATATESTAGAVTIAASGVAGTVLMSGAGGMTLSTTNSAISVQPGTGALNLATAAAANTTTIGNVTAGSAVNINTGTGGFAVTTTGTGDIALDSDDVMTLDSDGVLELNSSAGIISIGNDANAFGINVGTGAAARPIIIGNTTALTSVTVNTPVGSPVILTQGASISGVYVLSGAGSPSGVVTAPQGSLYLNTTGSSTSTRAYINTNAGTAWTAITTAS